MSNRRYKILIVEDDQNLRLTLTELLRMEGFSVVTARDGDEGYLQAMAHQPDLVITDMQMPDMNGAEMIEHLRHIVPSVKIIALSGSYGGIRDANRLVGSQQTIEKPFSLEQF